MKVTNLSARPDKYRDTIALIERSFGYSAPNSFDIDFYPLVKEENWKNCWIILINDKVVAHTAVLPKSFNTMSACFNALFIGGVAVDKNLRGQGLSRELLNHIFKSYPEHALYILWSEKIDMYQKHGFIPCVELFEHSQKKNVSSFKCTALNDLDSTELQSLKELYCNSSEIRVTRDEKDWRDISHIKSSTLYIKKTDGKIVNYFFINKGQDLSGIIHEYGSLSDVQEICSHGKLWSATSLKESTPLYGSLIKIGNQELFKQAIAQLTENRIDVISVGELIEFSFDGNTFNLSQDEFMQGILGPNRFEELCELPKVFISGLDSI